MAESKAQPNNLAAYSWSIADLLRGDFKQSQYGRIILPFTLLQERRTALITCAGSAASPMPKAGGWKSVATTGAFADAATARVVEMAAAKLVNAGRLKYVGPRRSPGRDLKPQSPALPPPDPNHVRPQPFPEQSK